MYLEIKQCKRCGKPMSGVKKISDISDICSTCLKPDEREYRDSKEFLDHAKKHYGVR